MKYIIGIVILVLIIIAYKKLKVHKFYAKCEGVHTHIRSGGGKTSVSISKSYDGGYTGSVSSEPGWVDEYKTISFDLGAGYSKTFDAEYWSSSKSGFGLLKWNSYTESFVNLDFFKYQKQWDKQVKFLKFVKFAKNVLSWLLFDILVVIVFSPMLMKYRFLSSIVSFAAFIVVPLRAFLLSLYFDLSRKKTFLAIDVFMIIDIMASIFNRIVFNVGIPDSIITASFIFTLSAELLIVSGLIKKKIIDFSNTRVKK